MRRTIDCRPARARDPGGTRLKIVGAAVAGLGAIALLGGLVAHPTAKPSEWNPAASTSTPTVTSAPVHAQEAAASPAADPAILPDGGLDYLGLKAEAEEKLRGDLTDDHGVRYRDVHTKLSTLDGGGIVAFCGEENSRTPLGGYGGFHRFIASRSVATVEGQMEPAEFAQGWEQFCESGVEGPRVWF